MVGALRAVLGGGVLVVVALAGVRHRATRLRRSGLLLVLAGACILAYQLTFFAGVSALGVAVGTILAVGSAPFFAGAASVVLGRHRPSRRWAATTALAVAGLVLLLRPDAGVSPSATGVLAAAAAGLSFGLYTVLAKELLDQGITRLDTVAVPFLIAGSLSIPILVAGLSDGRATALFEPRVLIVLAWLALGATAGGYLLFISGLRSVPAVAGATLVLAEPLTAALLGVGVLGERLGTGAILGAASVALALVLTAREPGPEVAR
jgi:DME family drug/metabolite transporter